MYDLPTSRPSSEFDFADDDMEAVTMNEMIDSYVPTTPPSDTSELCEDTFSHGLYNGFLVWDLVSSSSYPLLSTSV